MDTSKLAAAQRAEREPGQSVLCDACDKQVHAGQPVHFENTPDGGYLAHLTCFEATA